MQKFKLNEKQGKNTLRVCRAGSLNYLLKLPALMAKIEKIQLAKN
jgi:hypothetical protein